MAGGKEHNPLLTKFNVRAQRFCEFDIGRTQRGGGGHRNKLEERSQMGLSHK